MTATSTDDGLGLDTERTSTTTLPTDTPQAPSTALVPVGPPAPTAAPILAGAGLVAEAELAIEQRRWRDGLRVLDAIDSIGASSVHTDGLVAIAATHLHKSSLANEAIGRIRASTQTDQTQRALAAIALARHEYLVADRELRAAIDRDDNDRLDVDDWTQLAAIYSGLGWFDEATECLDRAETLGTTDRHRWSVGRATNHWAMSRSWGLQVGAVLFVLGFGLLSVAIGLTMPFMMREFRLTQLDERTAALANDAWSDERWLRLAHAAGVLLAVVSWALVNALA